MSRMGRGAADGVVATWILAPWHRDPIMCRCCAGSFTGSRMGSFVSRSAHTDQEVRALVEQIVNDYDDHAKRIDDDDGTRQDARDDELVMLIAAGEESSDCGGAHGTYTVTPNSAFQPRAVRR